MTDFIHIEPAHERRREFARWCLEQTPRIETASATGSDVPLDLYPSVPPELLEGAYVDGYLVPPSAPVKDPATVLVEEYLQKIEDGGSPAEALEAVKPTPRRRTARRGTREVAAK